jgi:hypothetical protein
VEGVFYEKYIEGYSSLSLNSWQFTAISSVEMGLNDFSRGFIVLFTVFPGDVVTRQ